MPRKRGVARYLRDIDKAGRLSALRQSPSPGIGRDEGEKEEENPDAERAGTEETALFDIVNRKNDAVRCIGQRVESPSRQRQRARVPAERAPRRAFARPGTRERGRVPSAPQRAMLRAVARHPVQM